MIWGPTAYTRLALIGLVGAILQLAAISQVGLFGVSPDLAPLLVAFVGLLGGSISGAAFGFALGLFIDLAVVQTMGVTSLVLTLVGYAAGRLLELRDPSHGLIPLAVGAAATALAAILFALVQFLIGNLALISPALVQQLVVVTLLNSLLALPLYSLLRRILDPCLPDDPRRRRRRRAYTTGGLSPISRY